MVSIGNQVVSPLFAPGRLGWNHFNLECTQLAKELLGQILVRNEDGNILRGRIVETEAYLGGEDLASHTHHGKLTERTAPAFMDPGTIYVAPVYGMYHLFNISSAGDGATVLLRALEPLEGIEEMKKKRASFGKGSKKLPKHYKLNELCNGPSKLAIAMSIDTHFSRDCLITSAEMWIEDGWPKVPEEQIVKCPRIGVDFAGKLWASKPLRYYILGNSCVSKRDKKAEKELEISNAV